MKVGLIEMFDARQFPYWSAFLKELGQDVLAPQLDAGELYRIGRESLADAPPHVQLLLGRVLALQAAELILVPPLPAVPNDFWAEAYAELLPRRFSTLPAMQLVPDAGLPQGERLESAATELGQRLTHNPAQVRLALEKARPLAALPREARPRLEVAGRRTVALVGPRALLGDPFLSGPLRERLEQLELHGVFASDFTPAQLRERGLRGGEGPAGTLELQGARGLLEGKSGVDGLLYVTPARDLPQQRALERVAARQGVKPHAALTLSPETAEGDWNALDELAARLRPARAGIPVQEPS